MHLVNNIIKVFLLIVYLFCSKCAWCSGSSLICHSVCVCVCTCSCSISFKATAQVTLAPPAYQSSPIKGTLQLVAHPQALQASLNPVRRARATQCPLLLLLEPVAPCQQGQAIMCLLNSCTV